MTFRQFRDEARSIVEDAIREAELPSVAFEPSEPPRTEFGDLSVNVAFTLAAKTGLKPQEIAGKLTPIIKKARRRFVADVEAHPSGYVNLFVNQPLLSHESLSMALSDVRYGAVDIGRGVKAIVEHTSVNPNKALHYGHLRNLTIGDSLSRILAFAGYDVEVLNYVDDSGPQVADLIVGFKHLAMPAEPPKGEKFDHYCGDIVYVKVNELYEKRPELVEVQKRVLREMEQPGSEASDSAKELTLRILMEQLKTCWRIGGTYDCLVFESHVVESRLWESVFEDLKLRGVVKLESEGKLAGCWVAKIGEAEEDEKVLVRSDGTVTYAAKDIPFAEWKLGLISDRFSYKVLVEQPGGRLLWSTYVDGGDTVHPKFGGGISVNVIDVRQKRLQHIIQEILVKLAGEEVRRRYVHLGYELVSLSRDTAKELGLEVEEKDFLQMSGRRGIYVNADDVLDAVHLKAYQETKKRNTGEREEWLQEIAEKVAVAAIRFDLLKPDLERMIVFDLQEALSLEGETGPYIQYAHARACRIVEKADQQEMFTGEEVEKLHNPLERALVKLISKFDLYVEEAARNLSPNVIAKYAYNLAYAFNAFYEKHPVLQETDKAARTGRLALVLASRNCIRQTLSLLGIEAPEKI